MNKHTRRNTEEDLWNWAERRETAAWPEQAKTEAGSSLAAGALRPTGTMMRRWFSLLGFARSKRG